MRDKDYQVSVDFLKRFFGEALHKVELRACSNERSGGAASVFSSDEDQWRRFCEKRDAEGSGLYFGLCTRGDALNDKGEISGGKDNVRECLALWVDIDCAKQRISGATAIDALNFLPHPPTIIVNSGGGLHAYWLLEQAVDVSGGNYAAVEAALRQLALVLAGDMSVAEIARILRLPGTLNSKDATRALNDGEPILCEVLSDSGRVHDLDQLAEWLAEQRPVLVAAAREAARPVQEDDPFVAYAREAGFNPAIDIDDELVAMEHGATGNRSIHATQLRVSASMIARGYDDDEIVDRILRATEAAAPGDAKWNWGREESAIRGMIRTGRGKGYDRPKPALASSQPMTSGNNALKLVHDADKDQEPEPKKVRQQRDNRSTTVAVGEAVIGVWRDRHGPVMHTGGTTYAYEGGIWVQWDERYAQRLRAIIQEACASLGVEPKTALLNAAKAYFMDRPELTKVNVEFDAHNLLIADDMALDPATMALIPHSPDHYALFKVAARIEGDRTIGAWLAFLGAAFSDTADGEQVILTLQEWFGTVFIRTRARALKKGLVIVGPSRTGKTQISQVLRGTLGPKHVCGAPMRDLEGRFGSEPFLGKRGWVADDAIGEGEFLDADVYKKVVTGETYSVQRKGGQNIDVSFGFPVALTANSVPRVKDQSEAVYNRTLVLRMTQVRDEDEPEPAGYDSIAEKIIAEDLTGILWWAIEGWKRLQARGRFQPPTVMVEASRAFQDDNNPVGAWLKQCVRKNSSYRVARADLVASFQGWRMLEHDSEQGWKPNTVTRRLRQLLVGHDEPTVNGERFIAGIELNDEGLTAWTRWKNSRFGENIGTVDHENAVNKLHQPEAPKSRPASREPVF